MKRFLVLVLVLISLSLSASYPTDGNYQDISGGGAFKYIVIRSLWPDSSSVSQLGDSSQYFFRGYIDTLWVNSIRGIDLDSIGTNNPDSMGDLPASAYLRNTIDTSAILYITSGYIDSFLEDSLSSKSAFKMLNKSVKFTNATGDTVKALIQGDFLGLYDWANNVTSVVGNQGFYKYNTAGDSGYFYLKDSSLTFWDYSSQIPVVQIGVNDTGYGEIILSGNTNHLGMYSYGLGVTDTTEDSLDLTLTNYGLDFYRRADQSIYSQFGLNNLTFYDTTGGSRPRRLFYDGRDSFDLNVRKYFRLLVNGFSNARLLVDSNATWLLDSNITMTGKITAENGLINNKLTVTDSIATNTGTIDTMVNLKLTSDHSTVDTAIIDTAKIRGLYVQQGAIIDSGLEINGTDVIGLYVKHGNSFFFDDVSLEYKAPYYQSYFGIHDPRDSNAWLQTANDLRLYKKGITGSVFTDSLWLRLDSLGFKVVKYGTTDTTARVQDGYLYAADSVKTGKLGLTGSLSAIASAESLYWNSATGDGIVTGDWTVRDTLVTNLFKTNGFKYKYSTTDSIYTVNDDLFSTGSANFADSVIAGLVVVGDNAISDAGTYLSTNYLQLNTVKASYSETQIYKNQSGIPIIIDPCVNAYNDSILFIINGKRDSLFLIDSLNIIRNRDDVVIDSSLTIGGGSALSKFVVIGSHLAIIVGSDTFWVKTDSI